MRQYGTAGLTRNARVRGSIPRASSNEIKGLAQRAVRRETPILQSYYSLDLAHGRRTRLGNWTGSLYRLEYGRERIRYPDFFASPGQSDEVQLRLAWRLRLLIADEVQFAYGPATFESDFPNQENTPFLFFPQDLPKSAHPTLHNQRRRLVDGQAPFMVKWGATRQR